MSNSRYSQTLDGPTQTYARCNRDTFAALPHPDAEPWVANEVFEMSQTVNKLHRLGIVAPTGDHTRNAHGNRVKTWETVPRMHEALEKRGFLDPTRPPAYGPVDVACPECARVSFVNVDGDRLRCKKCETVTHKEAWR